MDKCMPAAPKMVGREFVKKYYTIMNKSPENLHCFYTDSASFMHDDIDSHQRHTITANGKMAIRDAMLARLSKYNEAKTHIAHVETSETLDDCLIVQVVGEISYNGSPMRPFSQTIILFQSSPFHYFVQNDIFRFCDFEMDGDESVADEPIVESETMMPKNEPEQMDQSDWGTQCADDIEPFEERALVKQTTPHVDHAAAPENEVKLDTSDSGLSSDAEKAIVDIQSLNLKSILQEKRSITKESVMMRSTPTPPPFVEETVSTIEQHPQQQQQQQPIETTTKTDDNQIPENKNSLFRDSCIITIGNTVNPNIEFDDVKCDEHTVKPQEHVDEKNDENSSSSSINGGGNVSGGSTGTAGGNGKVRNRKRKDKRKAKSDTSNEKSSNDSNDSNKATDTKASQTENNEDRPAVNNQSTSTDCTTENIADNLIKTEPNHAAETLEQETPKPAVKKSYADLAKSGTDEWIDEMANRRGSFADKPKARATFPRRDSRGDRPTPPNDGHGRFSPKNDLLQVFVGNIPHSASEDDIRKMFSRFGHLVRLRFHSNTRKEWLPQYAFITYDNIQSVRQCLMKKGTFYWPENGPDRQKLNVNGDASVDVWDDNGNQKSNNAPEKTREFKRFSKNFNMHSKDGNHKRSPHTNTDIADTMKNERRKSSTRA